jgi:LysR family transcriptional regulator, glycine cleavage system transcriptional activator
MQGERRLRWSDWLENALPTRADVHLPNGYLVVQAAALGQGLALVRRGRVSDYLRNGRLVQLLDDARDVDHGDWLVTSAGDSRPRVLAFIEWLQAEFLR